MGAFYYGPGEAGKALSRRPVLIVR